MYLHYITDNQIKQFLRRIDSRIINPIIRPADAEHDSVIVFSNQTNATFYITDFECIDIKSGKIYSSEFRKFMIEVLDKCAEDKNLGDKYINDLHTFLEQDTICGAII